MSFKLEYGNLDLTTGGYTVTSFGGYSMATREIKSIPLAGTDGSEQVDDRLTDKSIPVGGDIKAANGAELIQLIDQLKQFLYRAGGLLKVTDEDGVEQLWRSTARNLVINRDRGGATQATYSFEFYSPKPYSYQAVQTFHEGNITVADYQASFPIPGTYPASPYITLTINSIAGTTQAITIRNPGEGRGITLTEDFVAGDVITLDTDKLRAFVNSERTDYTGKFPKWFAGAATLQYTDDQASRDIDILVTGEPRKL